MHEYGITSMLVKNIIKQVSNHKVKRVIDVEVEIGEFAFLNFDQIQFCYESLIPNSILEGSKIILNEKKGTVKCDQCNYLGNIKTFDDDMHYGVLSFMCPNCDGFTKIVNGRDFVIKRIKMVS
ncbi:MAG: putative hydrogenase nickel incorporation protein HypA [Candidatus Heimdallarchaeota archaeon LC_2]|nr:MAG: putative hydrogenase nickel incorporation protein HypA [Candidatus Heimdallarchaeota archaeon LC_2]